MKPRMHAVLKIVARSHGLNADELIGPSRRRHIAYARFIFCWIAYRQLGISLARIGKFLGNRDHTTILHAVKTAEVMSMIDEDDVPNIMVAAMTEQKLTMDKLKKQNRQMGFYDEKLSHL